MSMKRRTFLKGALASGAIGAAVSAGLLTPLTVLAAWPKKAFEAKTLSEALSSLTGAGSPTESGEITITAPEIAENGLQVPIKVSTSLPAESISILADGNPVPLIATYEMNPSIEAYISTRIKMGKTSNVLAIVKSGGKIYSAKKEVKVTIGGCGG